MIDERKTTSMQLRDAASNPPTAHEMAALHQLHRTNASIMEAAAGERHSAARPDEIEYHTHSSVAVVFPEKRNVHGKAFGGFVASSAYDLAYYAARYFVRGAPFVPVGLDEALFMRPVAIGDMVRFKASVVHAGDDGVFRVAVTMGVTDPTDPARWPTRTNRLMFIFATSPRDCPRVLPRTYGEVLMHVDAARRHTSEGVGPAVQAELNAFFHKCEMQRR